MKRGKKKERERKRKYRESMKLDHDKLEKARKYDRDRKKKEKEEGKIKTINDMSEREKRRQRKKWREATQRHRENIKKTENANKFIEEHTPPHSPIAPPVQISSNDRNKAAGQKRSRQRRERDKKEIKKLALSLEKAKKRTDKWRKKYKRLLKNKETLDVVNSPGKIAENIIRSGQSEVRRNLIVGAALSMQLKQNSAQCNSQEKRKSIAEHICGPIVFNKKIVKDTLESDKIVSRYYLNQAYKIRNRRRAKRKTHINQIKAEVVKFFEDNENSCQAPGKKEYITRNKVQKQKRYLLFSLKELHKKFKDKTGFTKICYQTFIKIKPFWVVAKKLDQRDTCLCKTHANFKFILDKLKLLKVIESSSISTILKGSVCNTDNMECMYSTCKKCSVRIPNEQLVQKDLNDFGTFYYRWEDIVEEVKSKKSGKMLKVKRTIKKKVFCSALELLKEANSELKTIAVHIFNMLHQHRQYNAIKKDLKENEALIICDWSENYNCKYGEEVQSIHFGASRKQVSLHTGVVYIGEEDHDEKILFCTVSNDTNHRATAVWTHLYPLLQLIKEKHANVNSIIFFTDGPTSQYRNKTNFFLMCNVCATLDFDYCSWNFWEAGHGKGVADGIGGLVKRSCDRSVAMGNDITDAQTVMATINNLNICSFLIGEHEFEKLEKKVKEAELKSKIVAVPGTMKLKSLIWKRNSGDYLLLLRRLSCSTCRKKDKCEHYTFKKIISEWNLLQPLVPDDKIGDNQLDDAVCQSYDESSSSEAEDFNRPRTSNAATANRRKLHVHEVFTSEDDEDIEENCFVLVKCEGKKAVYHYVAKVLKKHGDGDVSVSFLRFTTGGKFVFPNISEERSIPLDHIVMRLKGPIVSRGRHYFEENFSLFKNLN